MSAPSSQSFLCFCLQTSSCRKSNRRGRKGKRLEEKEWATVNVVPQLIAQAAQHSLVCSTSTSIRGNLRAFCSSMWQLGCQIKLGKANSRTSLLAAISRHHIAVCIHVSVFLSLTHRRDYKNSAQRASLSPTWTQKHAQCYGNYHIPEQCRVPDPADRGAVNRAVSVEAWPMTLATPGLSLLSVRSLSSSELQTLARQQQRKVRAVIPNHASFSPPAFHVMASAWALCLNSVVTLVAVHHVKRVCHTCWISGLSLWFW